METSGKEREDNIGGLTEEKLWISGLAGFLFSLVSGLICFFVQAGTGVIYTETDNFSTAVIVNGLLGDSNYCHILHPWLCNALGKLSVSFPQMDVFAFATELFIFISFVWLSFLFTRRGRALDTVLSLSLLLTLTVVFRIFSVNYLVQAGFMAFAGAVSVLSAKSFHRKYIPVIIGVLIFSFAMMLRSASVIMFIPFIILGLLEEILEAEDKKRMAVYAVLFLMPVLLSYLVLTQGRKNFYKNPLYQAAAEFDGARGRVGDYPMKEWEDLTEKPEGVTASEYSAAVMWMLFDTENITTEKLKRMAEAGSYTNYDSGPKGFFSAVKDMTGFISSNKEGTVLFLILIVLLLIRALYGAKTIWGKLGGGFSVLGAFLIVLICTMRGRAPLRVWQASFFAAISVLSMVPVRHSEAKDKIYIGLKSAALTAACIVLIDKGLGLSFHPLLTPFDARTGQIEDAFLETYRDNIVCIWGGWDANQVDEGYQIRNYLGGWYSNVCEYFIGQGKLPSKEFFQHNIPIGEWYYGQVCMNEHLKNLGVENPARALVERDDVFLVNGNGVPVFSEYVTKYLEEHFGPLVEADAGVIGDNPVVTYFTSEE